MDKFSRKVRSRIMSAIRSKHTAPEVAVRRAVSKVRLPYRLHYGKEKIDIAITSKKIAIFVDGCFWHVCPKHGHMPKINGAYWVPKLRRNKKRAIEKDKRLRQTGWRVIHIWECAVSSEAFISIIRKLRG